MPVACILFVVFLIATPAKFGWAQSIIPIGSPNTLDIATWNIEWFGSTNQDPSNDALQFENTLKVLSETEIDLWAVQEIASEDAFKALITTLGPDYEGQLATNSGTQRIGFIYDTKVIRLRQVHHILEDFESDFAFRPPLQLEIDAILPDTTVAMTFITVHMKAFGDQESYERRVSASIRLKNHIDFTILASQEVVVLGDFNDRLTQSIFAGTISPYTNFLQDTTNYKFLSYPLEMNGLGSFCLNTACTSTGNMIDHILITNELFDAIPATDASGVLEQLTESIFSFSTTTSDHLPVFARLNFTTISLSANDIQHANYSEVSPPFPNPVRTTTEFSYILEFSSLVDIQLFDVLGRTVWSGTNQIRGPGQYRHILDLTGYASGIYILRIRIHDRTYDYPLTVFP